jgi:disulfide bond formation protein DsbB
MKPGTVYTVLAAVVLTLLAIPVGGALVLGFVLGDSPCVMCWEQRIGMLIISLIGLFILRYGPRPRYIGLGVLVGTWGVFMAVRHTALHASRDIGQGFALEIMGAHTYTWAFVIYWICVLTMGVLLMTLPPREIAEAGTPRTLRPLERFAFGLFACLVTANFLQAVTSTGPPPFAGQSDPVRYSFNPRHWVWSLEEWHLSSNPPSWRGRFGVDKPQVATANPDAAAGPFADLPVMQTVQTSTLALPLRGTPTDLAYEPTRERFALTTQAGVYILPPSLDRVERSVVVDPGFSVDLGTIGGRRSRSADHPVVGGNKSYVMVRENDAADADANCHFLEPGPFDLLQDVHDSAGACFSMARLDPATKSVFTITAPNAKTRRIVVSRPIAT